MTNTSPTTNIRYGVIALRSLNSDLAQDLFHGPYAVDLSYEDAYKQAKAEAEGDADEIEEGLSDPVEIDQKYEDLGYDDRADFIDQYLEKFSDMYESDEPTIEGELDGVKYRISWLGGAPLLWVLEGPIGYAEHLCSPCVPNAASLDEGFTIPDEHMTTGHVGEYECYVVPMDWLAQEQA